MNQPKPKGKPRGRHGGRKPLTIPTIRKNLYLTAQEWAQLKAIDPSPSQAIRKIINRPPSAGKGATNNVAH